MLHRQVEFAGLLAGAPNPVGGQELIDFMLTREYQEDLPLNNFVFPVLPDATLPSAFTDNAEVPDKPYSLPPDEVAANRDAWVAGWTDVMEVVVTMTPRNLLWVVPRRSSGSSSSCRWPPCWSPLWGASASTAQSLVGGSMSGFCGSPRTKPSCPHC
ncbi:MAG: hypothetical protein U0R64_09905 [Candidatus Nanopelagicales bacterium]